MPRSFKDKATEIIYSSDHKNRIGAALAESALDVVYSGSYADICDDIDFLKACDEKFHDRFCCEVYEASSAKMLKDAGIRWFFATTFNSFEEIKTAINQGADSVRIAGLPCFRLSLVSSVIGPQRTIRIDPCPKKEADISLYNDLACTFWVPPQQAETLYAEFPQLIYEFVDDESVSHMTAMAETYYTQAWTGDVGLLLYTPISPTDERQYPDLAALPPDFAHKRANCNQRCQFDACHYCRRQFERLEMLKKNKEKLEAAMGQLNNLKDTAKETLESFEKVKAEIDQIKAEIPND